MGVPKRKSSKQRGRQRRAANEKLEAPVLVSCPQCRALIRPHHLCPECGYYKAREVVAAK
ncbi:MAG TPA: 50S ribosomal protein L32 [Pelotomaculum sp.]|jgi:large subunit ribosomal protein L32|uniref:Large ribosomal subunit protein bL32 n=1 Tax=Pelotomaculum schinkii TaxID=78350 RepID=A0A4Y7R9R4_9FIRM|nr:MULTISPECIES: 50S ribosomal protein L32 [Pelotomaculum]TEB05522.1 50S ribosomal protein L32 [Pelotomaculum schinkii]TEB14523.1 50S ribosomal protein L32 [Pelotomaculum sp. FP]HBC92026.1 50S ribosomal protein L32 [Pelotomaculum sp.]